MNALARAETTAEDLLSRLKTVLPELSEAFPHVYELYVFGSLAKATFEGRSDVDVAVFLGGSAADSNPLLDLELGLWLEDRLARPVDVVVLNRVSAIVQHEVLRTGIRLFERSAAHRAAAELICFKSFLDARHYQRKRRETIRHGQ